MRTHPDSRHPRLRLIGAALLAALLIGAGFLLLPGCDSTPAEPRADNPFDPGGPYGGDPLQLAAAVKDTVIQLTWNQPQGFGITRYEISHSDNPDSNWDYVDEVEATTAAVALYSYKHPLPTASHWFRLQAKDDLGNFTITAYAVAASATVGPWVRVGSTWGKTATRYPSVAVSATTGDSIRIALDANYTDSLRVVGAGSPGDTIRVPYDLGPAAQGDTFQVYVQSFTGTSTSFTTRVPAVVNFRPNFQLVGSPATVATRAVDLHIPTAGVVRMRFANAEDQIPAVAWIDPVDTLTGFLLTDSAAQQKIWGQFEGDFGFDSEAISLTVKPDLLSDVSFSLVDSLGLTSSRTVVFQADATATLMRISETPSFTGVAWRPYAVTDTFTFEVSGGEGLKVLYAQFRNDWTDSDILTDSIIYMSKPVEIRFMAPLKGDYVIGGRGLEVRGVATPGSGSAAIDSVKFDGGDGLGFRTAAGTDAWSYPWDVPGFLADTPLTLRARAWAGTDSATVSIGVTVTQLAVRIDEPLDGAQLPRESEIAIAGRAASLFAGTPVDSVVVDITGEVNPEHLAASSTNTWTTWTATWTTPTVTAILNATITARAYAGGEMVTDEIHVTVAPQ